MQDSQPIFLFYLYNTHVYYMCVYKKELDGKTEITHQIEMKGLLAFVFAYLIGRTMKKNLPQEMEAMVKKAESLKNIS